MARLARFFLIALIAVAALAPTAAFAGCSSDPTAPGCLPSPPPGTPRPAKTPTPTAKPTTAPKSTPAPSHRFVPPVSNQTTDTTTPQPTAFQVEVSPAPAATTVIETQPLSGDSSTNLNVQDSASASSWIFGFIVGLLIGLLFGRASWGIKRRRRQQIFG